MFTLITDPPMGLYVVLCLGVVAACAVWIKTRSRTSLKIAAAAAAAGVLLALIDYRCESPREEATRRVKLMAAAATALNPEGFVEHVSQSFTYQGKTRHDLLTSPVWELLKQYKARVVVWGFGRGFCEYTSDAEVEIGFYARGEAPDGGFVRRFVKARFVREPDGAFRLKRMTFFNPADGGKNEDPIPGFP